MLTIRGRANSGVPRIIIRPMTLVSIPDPDLSLPMTSTTRTSAASNGSVRRQAFGLGEERRLGRTADLRCLQERDPRRAVVAVLDDAEAAEQVSRTRR